MNGTMYLSVRGFAAARDLSPRQVQRYLSPVCRIPGAERTPAGWRIPSDAPLPNDGLSQIITVPAAHEPANLPTVVPQGQPIFTPLGTVLTLGDAAAMLGTGVAGLHELAAAGHLSIGRFGHRKSWAVYLPPAGGAR